MSKLLEVLTVLSGPPIMHATIAVILGTLIVESMTDFVADHCTNTTEVGSIVRFRVEEWWLQNGGREHDDVHVWSVVSVHRLRSHEPLFWVHSLTSLAHLNACAESVSTMHILQQAQLRVEMQSRVVTPMLGVADHWAELGELLQSLLLRLFTQPRRVGDRNVVSLDQTLNKLFHTLLGRSREVALHILLANLFTSDVVHQRDSALPTIPHLRGTVEHLAVEVEACLLEIIIQIACRTNENMSQSPVLQILNTTRFPLAIQTIEEVRLAHDELAHRVLHGNRKLSSRKRLIITLLPCCNPSCKVKMRHASSEVSKSSGVESLVVITISHLVPMMASNTSLHGENVLGAIMSSLLVAIHLTEQEEASEHRHIGFANGRMLIFTVVRLIWKAQTTLSDEHLIHLWVTWVCIHIDREECWATDRVKLTQGFEQLILAGHVQEALEVSLNRLITILFQAFSVHEQVVDDLGKRGGGVGVLNDVAQLFFCIIGKLVEGTVTGLIGWQFIILNPLAIDGIEEVILRTDWSCRALWCI